MVRQPAERTSTPHCRHRRCCQVVSSRPHASATTVATACSAHAAFPTDRTTSALASASQDIFLRELISNAADACDKKRFLSLTEEGASFYEGRVRLVADKEANTLTIEDNGIGMTRADLKNNLGKIAQSGAPEG